MQKINIYSSKIKTSDKLKRNNADTETIFLFYHHQLPVLRLSLSLINPDTLPLTQCQKLYYFSKIEKAALIIRAHPAEVNIGTDSGKETTAKMLYELYEELPPNVILLDPNNTMKQVLKNFVLIKLFLRINSKCDR